MLATTEIFLFEEFRFDRREGLSRRDERGAHIPVAMGPRALDVLGVLVERAGNLVTKEEIMAAVWGRAVVENANLTFRSRRSAAYSIKGEQKEAAFKRSPPAATALSRP